MGEDEIRGLHKIRGDDELPSVGEHPPLPDDENTSAERYEVHEDGLYLCLDGELVRLDDPGGLDSLGDRTGVVAVALCELAITRLIDSGCTCRGSS